MFESSPPWDTCASSLCLQGLRALTGKWKTCLEAGQVQEGRAQREAGRGRTDDVDICFEFPHITGDQAVQSDRQKTPSPLESRQLRPVHLYALPLWIWRGSTTEWKQGFLNSPRKHTQEAAKVPSTHSHRISEMVMMRHVRRGTDPTGALCCTTELRLRGYLLS